MTATPRRHRAATTPTQTLRVHVRVQPGASRTVIGGRYGDEEPPVLVARVAAPAVDGRANRALTGALADSFGVRPGAVRIVRGVSARIKVVELDGVDPSRLEQLLRSGGL
jgi:uncharacterized protein (TIGR00251 family)